MAFAQEKPLPQIQIDAEPFTLAPGSSFSASGSAPAGRNRAASVRPETIQSDIDEAISIITAKHISATTTDTDRLANSAISSMLKTLDPHSSYYDPVEFRSLLGEYESEYSGTGSSIAAFFRSGQMGIYIISTFPGSPAEKSGLRFGDRITSVNGRPIAGLSPDAVRDLIRGKTGVNVRLTVERAASLRVEQVEVRREKVHEPAVPKGVVLRGGTGYIDVTNGFGNTTYKEFDVALRDLKERGITSLIIDLRGNRGGILSQAIKIAERFLPHGATIVTQRGRYSNDVRTWKVESLHREKMPLVVLVDDKSASASEVIAGAFQDNDRAIIVGQKTFGKGLVQNVLNLPGGAGLTLTAARYYTPTGRSIQRDYETTSLYDYYQNRRKPVEIGRSTFAAKTVTDRIVYGGDGINPDEILPADPMTPLRYSLLDPIFFFSRDYLNGRIGPASSDNSNRQEIRQKVLFGEELVDGTIKKKFSEFVAANPGSDELARAVNLEADFVERMLAYYLSLGAFGKEAAERKRIADDSALAMAANAIPRAAALSAAADHARARLGKEKGPSSLVLNGLK